MTRIDSLLRTALADLMVLDDRKARSVSENVALEAQLGVDVGKGRRPPLFRVWENGRALVVTARETRLRDFPHARETLEAEGWPVVERDSGGTAVPHGPGILQASLTIPQDRLRAGALEAVYEALCEPVRRTLSALGVDTGYGEVPGSFCDGRFNLVANGRKIAGTSQRWRGGLPPSRRNGAYVLAHMVLFVEADMRRMTELVNRFYFLAGSEERFEPGAMVSVATARTGAGIQRLTDRVGDRIVEMAGDLGHASAAVPPA